MVEMIAKMSAIVAGHIILTYLLWRHFRDRRLSGVERLIIGVVYGLCAVFSNHFNVNYGDSLLNIRDLSPLTAGLFFDPISGIIAGLIGGTERYIIGTYFGIGSYTRVACSCATIVAGFLSALLGQHVFNLKKPTAMYAFFMGAVVEVFHMYMVFVTHKNDVVRAFEIVKSHSVPMIFFTGLGLMLTSVTLQIAAGEWRNPLRRVADENIKVSQKFRFWLFIFTVGVFTANFVFSYMLQSQKAVEDTGMMFDVVASDIRTSYERLKEKGHDDIENMQYHIRRSGSFYIMRGDTCIAGTDIGEGIPGEVSSLASREPGGELFIDMVDGEDNLCGVYDLDEDTVLLITLPVLEVYNERDTLTYETVFSNIIMLALLYILVSLLVQNVVVKNLDTVNASLNKISNGNLKEEVSVYNTTEFASLSNDINSMVTSLKGYIDAAEKRVEQELILARTIQESAWPHNFDFDRDDFEIYATMDPARQVGGDFYDFFFTGTDRLALVIADVSGKGIPASLFMMRSRAAIRNVAQKGYSPGRILQEANDELRAGNDGRMFVTVWIGIIDLVSGVMKCANAGHEYPMLYRKGQEYELYKDKHTPVLGLIKDYKLNEYEIKLEAGDSIYVYTDGVPEEQDENDQMYGLDRLKTILNGHRDDTLRGLLSAVYEDIKHFDNNDDQFDDITMLGFRYKPGQ